MSSSVTSPTPLAPILAPITDDVLFVGGFNTKSTDYDSFRSVFTKIHIFTYPTSASLFDVINELKNSVEKIAPKMIIAHSMGALLVISLMSQRYLDVNSKIILMGSYINNNAPLSAVTNYMSPRWFKVLEYFYLPKIAVYPESSLTDNKTIFQEIIDPKSYSLLSMKQLYEALLLFPTDSMLTYVIKTYKNCNVIEFMRDELLRTKISNTISLKDIESQFFYLNVDHEGFRDNVQAASFFPAFYKIALDLHNVVVPP